MDYVDCKWTIFWLKLAWIYFGFLQKNVRLMEKNYILWIILRVYSIIFQFKKILNFDIILFIIHKQDYL